MKYFIYSILIVSLLLGSACTPVPDEIVNLEKVVFASSNLARDPQPQVDPSQLEVLADANTAFGLNFYHQISQQEGNLIFSPISLSLALSMTLAGAQGATRDEMLQALSLQALAGDLHPAFNALLQSINASQEVVDSLSEGDAFQLNIANSIWGNAGTDFKTDFLDTLSLNYGAGIYSVNYETDPEAARQAINAWVEDETAGKIPDLIPEGLIDVMTRLVLANAIYFNGSWLYPFNEGLTDQAPFTLLDGQSIDVEMMHLTGEGLDYARMEDYQLVKLPYLSSDFSMLLIVPDAGSFKDFEGSLSVDDLADGLAEMAYVPMSLAMPSFDFESSINANDVLISLGMQVPFDANSADFSGITAEEVLYISDVLHKATITVDEKGTEAAAATAVIMACTSMPINEPLSLVIDRPFMFSIMHNPTGSILFMGRVVQP